MGIEDSLGSLADIAEEWMPFTPQNLWDEFKEGQARDEARTRRQEDIAREEKWLERNSISGRISEGMARGLSLTAAAGVQPGNSQSSHVGQDTSYLSMNRAGQSANRRSERLAERLLQAQIDNQELQNLKLMNEIIPDNKGTGALPLGDSFMPGGSQSVRGARISEKPMERTTSYPGKPHMEPGAINSLGYSATETGLMPIPSKDIKERIEDSPYEWSHFYRYGITPSFTGQSGKPPMKEITKNFPGAIDAVWNPILLEWSPIYKRNKGAFPLGPGPKYLYDDYKRLQNVKDNGYPEGHLFHKKRR